MLAEKGHDILLATRGKHALPAGFDRPNIKQAQASYALENKEWIDFVSSTEAEVLIDIIGVDVLGTYSAALPACRHFIACGSLWMFGPPKVVPTPAITQSPCQFASYTKRYAELLQLQKKAEKDGVAFSAIMPPNICGPGKIPLDAHGGRDIEVHKAHAAGQPVKLSTGCNTLVGPCDACDIAQGFALAVENRDAAAGEFFNIGSAYALPAPQFVRAYADIYETEIPIEYVSYEDYVEKILPEIGANYHFLEHMLPDITKIQNALGYQPKFTPNRPWPGCQMDERREAAVIRFSGKVFLYQTVSYKVRAGFLSRHVK